MLGYGTPSKRRKYCGTLVKGHEARFKVKPLMMSEAGLLRVVIEFADALGGFMILVECSCAATGIHRIS